MSFNAGAITGSIGLNTSPLSDSIARSRGILGRFKGSTDRTFGAIKASIIGNLVGGLGSTAITSVLRGLRSQLSAAFASIDQTGKTARGLGLTTEALTGLQHAAGLSGVSGQSLSDSLQRMNRNLADAVTGTGTAKDALDVLGLSAQDLTSMAPDQAMGRIADALQAIQNPAQKTQLLMDIFGRTAGAEMAVMLAEGSAGLQRAAEDTEKLGTSLSAVDAAKVELANDAMKRAGDVITGGVQRAAVEVAPYIKAIADRFTDAATAGEGVGDKVSRAMEWVAQGVAKVSDLLKLFEAGWHLLQAGASKAIQLIVQGIGTLVQGINKVASALGIDAVQGAAEFFDLLDQNLQDAVDKSLGKSSDAFDAWQTGATSAAVAEFFADARAKAQEAAEKIAESGQKAGAGFVEPMTEAVEEVAEKVEEAMGVKAFASFQFANSAEELSLRQRQAAAAAGAGPGGRDYPKQHLDQQKETNRRLDDLNLLIRQLVDAGQPVIGLVGF